MINTLGFIPNNEIKEMVPFYAFLCIPSFAQQSTVNNKNGDGEGLILTMKSLNERKVCGFYSFSFSISIVNFSICFSN